MKKHFIQLHVFFFLFLISSLQGNLSAQMVGLTTNPTAWQDQKPNLGLQVSYPKLPWIAVYGDVTLSKAVYVTEGLNHVFSGKTVGLEARLFPFGGRSHLKLSNLKEAKFHKAKKVGCYSFAKEKHAPFSVLGGIYVAPGMELQRYNLTSTVRIYEQDVTTDYAFKSTGLSMHVGYAFSFEHISLGVSYGFYAMKPTVSSKVNNIPDQLVPKSNVWGFNSKQGLRFSVGVSF